MTDTLAIIITCLVGIPAYSAIGALVAWHYDQQFREYGGLLIALWPTFLLSRVLIVWPIRGSLALPAWLDRRRTARSLPRATVVTSAKESTDE